MPHRCALAVLLLALTAPAGADTLTGQVTRIVDGDTLVLLVETTAAGPREEKVRLGGIDCPERGQPFGQRAKQALADAVFGRSVQVETDKVDRYGRRVGVVLIGGFDVNLSLVEDGLCWWYRKYADEQSATDRRLYESAEDGARAARRGLWVDSDPIPPWEWRH
jgi:endonuclease YncB( thermonuclease family)